MWEKFIRRVGGRTFNPGQRGVLGPAEKGSVRFLVWWLWDDLVYCFGCGVWELVGLGFVRIISTEKLGECLLGY